MPAFDLFPYSHDNAGVKVIFRPQADASPTDVEQWRESQSNLPWVRLTTVLLPAVDSLPEDCRTRANNASHTYLSTGILPSYIRVYSEDMEELDSALGRQAPLSPSANSW